LLLLVQTTLALLALELDHFVFIPLIGDIAAVMQ
jgi:hypothetical protein